ncbi:MAG: antibiotic biosynthesis monooxygenase [Chloroflexi bacterium]|nr:antibiotic biosynthesis monooxygenase [Chloroflexota bacterium]
MFVAINRLQVPAEYATHLEGAFGRSAGMAGVPGFISFQLLRHTSEDEFLVVTTWQDEASFEAWRASDAFQRAHAETNPNSPVRSRLDTYRVVLAQLAT